MTLKKQTGLLCRTIGGAVRKTFLVGLGITAVVVENISDVVENVSAHSEQWVEQGEQTSQELNKTLAVRRQEIRQRAQANGHVKIEKEA